MVVVTIEKTYNMKPSEYYNEHYRVKDPQTGKLIKPKPLSKEDTIIMDAAFESSQLPAFICLKTRRGGSQIFINKDILF